MIKYSLILLISTSICSLFAENINQLIGGAIAMTFFVGILWELFIHYIKRDKNNK